jgi:hypothetical protein
LNAHAADAPKDTLLKHQNSLLRFFQESGYKRLLSVGRKALFKLVSGDSGAKRGLGSFSTEISIKF